MSYEDELLAKLASLIEQQGLRTEDIAIVGISAMGYSHIVRDKNGYPRVDKSGGYNKPVFIRKKWPDGALGRQIYELFLELYY